ncbi:MAG: ABC transporter permease [bacterium]
MRKIILIAKWELKEKFLHKSFLIYFFITQLILFLSLSLTKNESTEISSPSPIGIINNSGYNITPLLMQLNSVVDSNNVPEFLIINLNKNRYKLQYNQNDFEKFLFDENFNACLYIDSTNYKLYHSAFFSQSKILVFNKYLLSFMANNPNRPFNSNNISFSFIELTAKQTFKLSSLLNNLSINLIFIFVILISGNLFLRSFAVEKSNKLIEVLLSSTNAKTIIIGKSLGLFCFVLFQTFIWVLTSVFTGNNIFFLSVNTVWIIIFFIFGLILYVSIFTGLGSLINNESDSNMIMGIISFFLILPLLFIKELFYFPNSNISSFLTYFPLTSPSSIFIKSSVSVINTQQYVLTLSLLLIFIFLLIKLISYFFEFSIQNFGQKTNIFDMFNSKKK